MSAMHTWMIAMVGGAILFGQSLHAGDSREQWEKRKEGTDRIEKNFEEFIRGDQSPPTAQPAPANPLNRSAQPGVVVAGATEKFVSPKAMFVGFMPKGWKVAEDLQDACRVARVTDPAGRLGVTVWHGLCPGGNDAEAALGCYLATLGKAHSDLNIDKAWRRESRLAAAVSYTDAQRAPREEHIWSNVQDGNVVVIACDTPRGQYDANRGLLLSIAANIRPLKDATPRRMGLVDHKLRDGSATVALPEGWKIVADMGKGCFIAADAASEFSFMSATAQVLTPQWAGGVQNVPVAPFMDPNGAVKFLAEKQGLVDQMRIVEVKPWKELMAQAGGRLRIEEFTWTAVKGRVHSKGFSFGMTGLSETGSVWSLWHMTAAGPIDKFDAFVPTFAGMYESFRVDQNVAAEYVRKGRQRVQEMQRETMRIVQRNADDIRRINYEIFQNKDRSSDYLSYAWSQCIRGESDWISQVEGGTVYRSDSWGLTNTADGTFYEGRDWDYTHFRGQNPRYNELMQEVNNRELYEKYVRPPPR